MLSSLRMADDIDIEEHDVLENPLIKKIFPDLSILKKEIYDYHNYEHEEFTESSNADDSSSTTQTVNGIIEQNLSPCSSELIDNKIIIGSKHISNKNQIIDVPIKKAKIILPNIIQFLNNSNKFCKVCLILFPSQESLKTHLFLVHKDTENTNKIKRSNFKCQKCNVTFVNLGNLKRHERNIHLRINRIKNKNDDKHITEVDVMVKVNDSNVKNLPVNNLKECFHCDMMFKTQKLLIDHLYDVLNSKKTPVVQNKTCTENKQQINETNERTQVEMNNIQTNKIVDQVQNIENDSIYVCPICSYYFNIWNFYEAHMKKKHGVNKVKRASKVSYKPTCKFCDLQYSTFKSYNVHLHKSHKNKILQKVTIQSNNVKKKSPDTRRLFIQKKVQLKKKIVLDGNKTEFDNTVIQQKNNEDQLISIKNDVKVMALKTIIFKCTQCNVHFLTNESAKNHINHSLLENEICINCKRIFKANDNNLHLEQHRYSNYFSVINISEDDKLTPNINDTHRILHKCKFCAVHFSKEHIFEHYSICETEQVKQSTYCKICDILIAENIKISHDNEHNLNKLKPSDFEIVEFKNIRNKPIIRKKLKLYEKMYLFNLSYCNLCKCNVSRAHYKSTIHLQSRCSHFIRYVCKYCGLVFSNKSINTHRKLHQKYNNLSLKDFTFFDLKNGKKILPPIPVFPKCNSCEKHFITKSEVSAHVCFRNNHLTCPVCKIKLSQTAYKLHIPFHDLNLHGECKETELSIILENGNINMNLASLNEDFETKADIITIFTCKNCDVSFNLYDEAIEHCHLHTTLDTIYPDTVECGICKLNYDASCNEEHQQLHKDFPEGTFKYIKFDLFDFGSANDKWLKKMFGPTSQGNAVHGILKNAIYQYETRLKMRIIQNGSSDRTVYKCDKCQSLIDIHTIYEHYETCSECEKNICNICHLPTSSNDDHEQCNTISKSFRIIEFNRKEDENVNCKIAAMRKCFVLYECRSCHTVVDKKYQNHLCTVNTSKECSICGLLLNELDYDTHVSKHKRLTSFNGNFMKVILLGTKPNINNSYQKRSLDILSKFSGIVCDYTFYKCSNCDVCVRDQRNTTQHHCLIQVAKSKCPKCDLTFDEGKLKGHLKLHDTDPDFVKETILLESFNHKDLIKKMKSCVKNDRKENTVNKDKNSDCLKNVKIYKCICGLHYLTRATIEAHSKKCNGKVKTKQCKQNCSKCDLTFTPEVLFKHLIEHHGQKDNLFEYEIISLNSTPTV